MTLAPILAAAGISGVLWTLFWIAVALIVLVVIVKIIGRL